MTRRHLPALDGVRGLAVAGVLLFHAGFTWLPGGFLGVSTFFTLSGFLITTLLLDEWAATGRIDLRRFWSRRARRLLPAAMLTLVGVGVYGALVADPHQLASMRADSLSALGYVANWRFLYAGHSYADLFATPSPVQHFWSLAIEEQFYVVFPLLVVAVLVARRRGHHARRSGIGGFQVALAALITGSVLIPFVVWRPGEDIARVYYGTDTRAAELLVGALLATLLHGRRLSRTVQGVTRWASLAALAALAALWSTARVGSAWLYRGGLLAAAVLAAAVIVGSLCAGPAQRLLALWPLAAAGRISYGLYLFHWPVFLWLDHERTGLGTGTLFLLRAAVTLALAVASYHLLEQPIRAGRALVGWRPKVAVPGAAFAVAAVTLLVTVDVPRPAIVFEAASAEPVSAPPTTTVASRVLRAQLRAVSAKVPAAAAGPGLTATRAPHDGAMRVMVVGDSVAVTAGRGLERWGPDHGLAVWNVARKWCGIGRGGDMGFRVSGDDCDAWAPLWSGEIADFDPDAVVVLSVLWDLPDRQMPQWGDSAFRGPGDPQFDEWMTGEYDAAIDVLSARGAHVLWLTAPCFEGSTGDQDERIAHLDNTIIPGAARARPAVTEVADLFGEVCPNGVFSPTYGGVADSRPDGLHFSDPGADALAEWLGPLATDTALVATGMVPPPPPAAAPAAPHDAG